LFCYSYKEEDSGATDSDDIIEAPEGEEEEKEKEEENKESIEKILDHRLGKKGGKSCQTSFFFPFLVILSLHDIKCLEQSLTEIIKNGNFTGKQKIQTINNSSVVF
jgi:hypothetical protein